MEIIYTSYVFFSLWKPLFFSKTYASLVDKETEK